MMNQQGYSTMVLVMLLLFLGLTLLHHTEKLYRFSIQNAMVLPQYYQRYHLSASSVEWAKTRHWSLPEKTWQCQQSESALLIACIKISSHPALVLVKGGQFPANVYALATYDLSALQANLYIEKGNWLDYCPEKNASFCD